MEWEVSSGQKASKPWEGGRQGQNVDFVLLPNSVAFSSHSTGCSHDLQAFGSLPLRCPFEPPFQSSICGFSFCCSVSFNSYFLGLLSQGQRLFKVSEKSVYSPHKVNSCFLMKPHTLKELVKILHTKIAWCFLCETRVLVYPASTSSLWFSVTDKM